MGARDYIPSLGRFAQSDPMGYGDGMNFYGFAHNGPISGNDPSGLGGPVRPTGLGGPPPIPPDILVVACRPGQIQVGDGSLSGEFSCVNADSFDPPPSGFSFQYNATTALAWAYNKPATPQNTQHQYHIRVPNNCSASDSMWALQQPNMSAPGSPQAQEGTTRNIQLWGNGGHNFITQIVNSGAGTITNITQPGHQFYPGQVVFQVTPNGSGSIVDITGTGSGPAPLWSDIIGYAFFGSVAENLAISCGAPGN